MILSTNTTLLNNTMSAQFLQYRHGFLGITFQTHHTLLLPLGNVASVLQSVLAHHSYLCHSPSNRCQRCGGHTTCVATAKMRPRDTYGREGSMTITIWSLGDRICCTHGSKEVAVSAGLTVVPFNPAMARRN